MGTPATLGRAVTLSGVARGADPRSILFAGTLGEAPRGIAESGLALASGDACWSRCGDRVDGRAWCPAV